MEQQRVQYNGASRSNVWERVDMDTAEVAAVGKEEQDGCGKSKDGGGGYSLVDKDVKKM